MVNLLNFASNSIIGFTNSVYIGNYNISKILQDLLRMIDIWFIVGYEEIIDNLINQSFESININSWILVIPQLLARVNIKEERIQNSLCKILTKIGISHPRALVYP